MPLIHSADELPPERDDRSPVTLLGAAHHWAAVAKDAEARMRVARRRARLLTAYAILVTPPALVALVLLWMRA